MIAMLLEASLRVSLVAGSVALILLAGRVHSSSARHSAWTAVLAAMLLMPVLPYCVPAIRLPIPVPSPGLDPLALITAPEPSTAAETLQPAAAPAVATNASPRGRETAAAPPASHDWPAALLTVYGTGMVLLLLRLALGWRGVTRVARTATKVAGTPFFESPIVTTPVTAGVFSPRIVLPPAWRKWPEDKRRAVLAHELAHVRRRDPLVAWLAHVNRCVFWFHPLAWWLERALAATAEEACDVAAVREIGESRKYAEVLLDIADDVRQSGGRIAWQAIGVDGNGLLGRRIDRILRGDLVRELSPARKIAVALSCAAAIAFVVACRDQLTAAPLRGDPEVAERLARQKTDQAMYESARAMTAPQVDALEAALAKNPADFVAAKKLKAFYQASGQKVFGWNEMIARRRPQVLRLIEDFPDHEDAVWLVSPAGDPVGYAEAKKRWLAQAAKSGVKAATLFNAAQFFTEHDPQLAEEMLLEAKARDPEGKTVWPSRPPPSAHFWSNRLGYLYARTILGPRDPRDGRPLRSVDDDSYAQALRDRLTTSSDAAMLTAAGELLIRSYRDPARAQIGRQCLERALQLDPAQIRARRSLFAAADGETDLNRHERLRLKQAELAGDEIAKKVRAGERLTQAEGATVRSFEYDAVSALPEEERLGALADLSGDAYMWAEHLAYTVKDAASAKASYERSKKAASDVVSLAPRLRAHPDYSVSLYRAEVALGLHGLREGDRKTAVKHMLEAVNVPPSDQLALGNPVALDGRLVNYLLKAGERESVAEFLEKSAKLRTADASELLRSAAAIREGRMPMSYQYMVTREQ